MKAKQAARLEAMANLVLGHLSQQLTRAAAAREDVRRRIAALDRLPPEGTEDDLPLQNSGIRYEGWATPRRLALQREAAVCEARWLAALEESRRAFTRVQLLEKLRRRDQGRGGQ